MSSLHDLDVSAGGPLVVIGRGEEPNLQRRARTAKDLCDELARAIIDDQPREDVVRSAQHFDKAVIAFESGLQRDNPTHLEFRHSCEATRNMVNDPDGWEGDAGPKLRRMLRGLQELARELQKFIDQQG